MEIFSRYIVLYHGKFLHLSTLLNDNNRNGSIEKHNSFKRFTA